MPNLQSPPKHKTPNYRLVRRETRFRSIFVRLPDLVRVSHAWEPVPLRADRKDLQPERPPAE